MRWYTVQFLRASGKLTTLRASMTHSSSTHLVQQCIDCFDKWLLFFLDLPTSQPPVSIESIKGTICWFTFFNTSNAYYYNVNHPMNGWRRLSAALTNQDYSRLRLQILTGWIVLGWKMDVRQSGTKPPLDNLVGWAAKLVFCKLSRVQQLSTIELDFQHFKQLTWTESLLISTF